LCAFWWKGKERSNKVPNVACCEWTRSIAKGNQWPVSLLEHFSLLCEDCTLLSRC
jgi:hypothetical protein